MRRNLILAGFLLAACFAFTQDTTQPKSAATEKQQCSDKASRDLCFAYARGVKDVMDGDLAWDGDEHKKILLGSWTDGVTVDQIVLAFLKFANDNPAAMNQPAAAIFRQSAEAAKLYTYSEP
jgi:Ssp1 endopeptidase immunity protein Rap1a